MSKQFWAIIAVIVVVFVGVVAFSNRGDNTGTSGDSSGKPTSHIKGKGTTGVKLVEYGDYQCPVCGTFYSATEQVQEKYKDQIFFQFRNLPLPSLHPNAVSAARAAEAAGLQGKYWEMHNLLYQNQSAWSSSSNALEYFKSYAKSIKLNLDTFTSDYKSTQVNNAINADVAAFEKTGDDKATPTYYLDGKKLDNTKLTGNDGLPSVEAFSKYIDEAIQAKQ